MQNQRRESQEDGVKFCQLTSAVTLAHYTAGATLKEALVHSYMGYELISAASIDHHVQLVRISRVSSSSSHGSLKMQCVSTRWSSPETSLVCGIEHLGERTCCSAPQFDGGASSREPDTIAMTAQTP